MGLKEYVKHKFIMTIGGIVGFAAWSAACLESDIFAAMMYAVVAACSFAIIFLEYGLYWRAKIRGGKPNETQREVL